MKIKMIEDVCIKVDYRYSTVYKKLIPTGRWKISYTPNAFIKDGSPILSIEHQDS